MTKRRLALIGLPLIALLVMGQTFGPQILNIVVAAGKLITFSNTLTFSGTDGSSVAFGTGGTIGATGYSTTGQIQATATNDSAAAGKIGEFITATSVGNTANVTITIASPGVVTMAGHVGQGVTAVVFSTTGALPTGLTAGTTYFTLNDTLPGVPFKVAATIADALAGTAINTSGSQSGTQTASSIIPLSTGVVIDVAAIPLTVGDWDVVAGTEFVPGGTTVWGATDISISNASVTRTAVPFGFMARAYGTTGGPTVLATTPPLRVLLSGSATYYGIIRSNFTVSTMTTGLVFGIRARRMR